MAARRADTYAFELGDIVSEVVTLVYADFKAERRGFDDLIALFNTSALCRVTVTDVLGAELARTELRVFMVRHGQRRLELTAAGRSRSRPGPFRPRSAPRALRLNDGRGAAVVQGRRGRHRDVRA